MSPATFGLRDVIGGAIVFALFMLAISFCGGCGKSALEYATITVGGLRVGQSAAVGGAELRLTNSMNDECGESLEPEVCSARIVEAGRPAERALNGSAATVDRLTDEVAAWALAAQVDPSLVDKPPATVCSTLSLVSDITALWLDVGGVSVPVPTWECPHD